MKNSPTTRPTLHQLDRSVTGLSTDIREMTHTWSQELQATELRLIDRMDMRFDRMEQRFSRMDVRFEAMEKRFDRIDERFNKMDERFNQVDTRLNQIDNKLDLLLQRVPAPATG